MMKSLYSDDQKIPFSQLFANPGALYRDTPFWGWNSRLDGEELHRQIGIFHQMGMGGFHMHARTGLGTPYLGTEFMKLVRQCVGDAMYEQMMQIAARQKEEAAQKRKKRLEETK